MLRLSKLTDYAVVVLVRLARCGETARCGDAPRNDEMRGSDVQTSPGIAAAIGIPEPTVAKVLKTLAGAGLVASQRGARGGYRLTRPLEAIPVSDVIAPIDGPIALAACVARSLTTSQTTRLCTVAGRRDPAIDAIQSALAAITLADMQEAAIPQAFRLPGDAGFVPGHLPAAE